VSPIDPPDLVPRVAAAIRSHAPSGRCMPCLARHVGASEFQVRDAAQFLVLRGSVKIERGVCSVCGRTLDVPVVAKG
jgi:hypothetical protein